MFVDGALEYEKPFMGPLYRFLSLHPRGSIRRVPAYVTSILRYLVRQFSHTRHFPCATSVTSIEQAPRVDAQASSERTGIGGWLPELDSNGRPSPSTSRWFSHATTKEEFPWVFERGRKTLAAHLFARSTGDHHCAQGLLPGQRHRLEEVDQPCTNMDRQQRKRVGIEQINVDPLSSERSAYGACVPYEAREDKGVSLMGTA